MTSPELLTQIQNHFTQIFPMMPSTKNAQMVLLCWTKLPSEQTKSLNDISMGEDYSWNYDFEADLP